MNKKRLWIFTGIIATVIVIVIANMWFVRYQKSQAVIKDKKLAQEAAESFSSAWYNFKLQTDGSYNLKIKPFMTPDFYDATYYVNSKRPQDFVGQEPMTSKVLSSTLNGYADGSANVTVYLENKEGSTPKIKTSVVVGLLKVDERWLANSLE